MYRSNNLLSPTAATVEEFTLNGQSRNVTVRQGDSVQLLCNASGDPAPTLKIMGDNEKVELVESARAYSIEWTTAAMAECDTVVTYSCEASNSAHGGDVSFVTLFVHCEKGWFVCT